MRFGRVAVVAFAWLAAGGCYRYVSVSPLAIPDDATMVSAELSDGGVLTMAPLIGPGIVALEGPLRLRSDTTVLLSVNTVSLRGGTRAEWRGEQVQIPLTAIQTVRVRKLDRSMTTIATAGVVAALVAVIQGSNLAVSGFGSSKRGRRNPGESLRAPIAGSPVPAATLFRRGP